MAKPPGVDPAKLAEHAKSLSELGYKDEAAKLYSHACNWGYSPACAKLKTSAERVAGQEAMPTQVVAQPTPAVKPASTKPAAVVAQAPTIKPIAPPAPPSVTAHPALPPAPAPSATPVAAPPANPAPALSAAPPVPASPPPVVVASVKPAPAIDKPAAPVDPHKLSQQAQGLEEMGYLPVAIKLYKDACLGGDGHACKRLGEIYIQGSEGVERDYAESVRWYGRARQLGIAVPTLEKRSVYR
ncbi:MAG: sel1 repeat family protein [Thiobacillus sp.]|nr:sel1 repeat family protein [Thiobacillus sp.]